MTPEIEALRSNRVVIVSVVAAAISITLLALVGIAAMLGWVGGKHGAATLSSMASPARQPAGNASGVALVPGETLVTPAETAAPPAATPLPEPAARPQPRARAEPAPRAGPATPAYARPGEPQGNRAPRKSTRAQPTTIPGNARSETHPIDGGDPSRRKLVCRTCGTVTSIATLPDLWELRVRLEDGATLTVRYPSPPSLRIGDRVRLANGQLVRE